MDSWDINSSMGISTCLPTPEPTPTNNIKSAKKLTKKEGKEENIYLKRGIFRLNKQFCGKKYDTFMDGDFKEILEKELQTLSTQM